MSTHGPRGEFMETRARRRVLGVLFRVESVEDLEVGLGFFFAPQVEIANIRVA